MTNIFAYIPSPSHGVWNLGPIPIRAYAFLILAAIGVAIWLGNRRWIERGGLDGQVADVAMWAVPFGVLGGRLYHVLTDWGTYFGPGGRGLLATFRIWDGGLGIWGAVALGALGAYIGCARAGLAFTPFADALAPGLVFAQAIGRWGNWFNQELFGKPTNSPWGLQIDPAHRPAGLADVATYHPTFLYESLACVAIGFALLWADKKFTLGHGRVFALYGALYCSARGLIETMRIDEASKILGIRINVFTAIILGILALRYLVHTSERFAGRELLVGGRYAPAGYIAPTKNEQDDHDEPVASDEDDFDPERQPDSFAELITELEPVITPESISASESEIVSPVESELPVLAEPKSVPESVVDEPKPRGRRAKPKGFKY